MDYEILTFTEAQHAFFNDTNPAALQRARGRAGLARVNDWFGHDKN